MFSENITFKNSKVLDLFIKALDDNFGKSVDYYIVEEDTLFITSTELYNANFQNFEEFYRGFFYAVNYLKN